MILVRRPVHSGRARRRSITQSPDALWKTADLLAQARSGDQAALERLFRAYELRLRQFLHGRLPAGAHALHSTADSAQEVWLRAVRSLERFEPGTVGSFWAWLRTIAKHHILDQRRRVAARPEAHPLDGAAPLVEEGVRSPRSRAISHEEMLGLEAALDELDERERNAFLLRVELDFRYEDIARDLGFPSSDAARKSIERSTKKLARRMGGEHGV